MSDHIHVIPVPMGMSGDEAWAEICMFGKLVDPPPIDYWLSLRCEGNECRGVEIADA